MKFCFLITLVILSGSFCISAQFDDFPAGYGAVPRSKLKGPVRTVLLVEKNGDNIIGGGVQTYDQKGLIVESLSSNSYLFENGYHTSIRESKIIQQTEKYVYIYDKRDRLIRRNHFIDDRFIDYELYEIDNQNRRTSAKRFSSDGTPREVFTMKYSDTPREVRVTWQIYESGKIGRPNGAVLRYDERGTWISRLMDIDDEPVTFEYDQYGNLVKEINCCKYNFWYVYANKLDRYGNWIERERIYFQKDKDGNDVRRPETQTQYRVITYFGDKVENSQ